MELRPERCPSPTDVALATGPRWARWLTEVERRLLPHFARREARHRGWASLRGLRSPVERNNGWQVAEAVGDTTPYGVEPLLGRARGDAEEVGKDCGAYVVEHLGDPQAVFVLDETGFRTHGQHSAGGARPSRGPAGRVEHAPMGGVLP